MTIQDQLSSLAHDIPACGTAGSDAPSATRALRSPALYHRHGRRTVQTQAGAARVSRPESSVPESMPGRLSTAASADHRIRRVASEPEPTPGGEPQS
jgi:hypothetical protein